MNIDYVVVSTDNNPFYDGYWEIVKKTWKHVVGVKSILVIIGDEDYHNVYDDYEIIGYKKVDDIPTSFQSQVSRLFATKTYLDKTFLTTSLVKKLEELAFAPIDETKINCFTWFCFAICAIFTG